jgi:hypothetical protein
LHSSKFKIGSHHFFRNAVRTRSFEDVKLISSPTALSAATNRNGTIIFSDQVDLSLGTREPPSPFDNPDVIVPLNPDTPPPLKNPDVPSPLDDPEVIAPL